MTSEERTGKILDILKAFRREWTMSETLKRLESEIIGPAIEEEREACARSADDEEARARELQLRRGDYGGDMFRAGITQGRAQASSLIGARIRARARSTDTRKNTD